MIGRFSSISMGKKKERKYSSKIYRPTRPAAAGPGGLNKYMCTADKKMHLKLVNCNTHLMHYITVLSQTILQTGNSRQYLVKYR